MTRPRDARIRGLGPSLGLLGCLLLAAGPPRPAEPPNIVLITIDTLRFDKVGFGDPRGRALTPHLDALARESAVYERAVTPIGSTLPSHATMFTGLYPREHGVWRNGLILDARYHTLAERLREAGFATQAIVSLDAAFRDGGLVQGFDVPPDRGEERILPGATVNRKFTRWLRLARKGPFFLWLHYYEVHPPYRMTEYARSHLGSYEGPLSGGAPTELYLAYGTPALPDTAENLRMLRVVYEGAVVEADKLVGEVVASLRASGELDRTVLVVTSDHGEALWEHGYVGHGRVAWKEVLDVPLLVRDPRRLGPRRVADRVGLIDLFPTVLDLAGVAPPGDLPGRSLVPLLAGGKASREATPYFADVGGIAGDEAEAAVVFFEGEKLLFPRNGEPAPLDPQGLRTALSLPSLTVERLKREAAHHRKQQPRFAGRPMSEESLEQLRALGYVSP